MLRILVATGLLSAGCGPRQAPPEERAAEQAPPPAAAPADVSHGEAPVGSPAVPPPHDPKAPPPSRERLHRVRLEIHHAVLTVDSGVTYDGWTFGGTAPGPTLRVTQGDTVDFTLVNRAPIPHSMDFHAAELAPDRYYVNLLPGDSIRYRFVARVPGVFMYHCGTAPVAAHIANGMYGALIVDPARPRPPAAEFVLVQSEFYPGAAAAGGGARSLDWARLLDQAPAYVVFNGRAAQYARHPIVVRAGELIRFYVVNAGPNRVSSFHVVGGIFERVFEDGRSGPTLEGVQTALVPIGGGAIFEIQLAEPGTYPFVTHAFADATKGAVGMLQARERLTGGQGGR